MAWNESVTPDAYHDPLMPPVHLCHYTYRIPDGHTVPQPPPLAGPARPPVESHLTRRERVTACLAFVVVALGVLIGVLR